jgi:hypothetical protein
MHYGIPNGSTTDDLEFDLATGSNEFSQPISDMVFANGEFLTAFTDGKIVKLQTAGLEATKAFQVTETGKAVKGGISDLEVDSTTTRLLALSTVGHSLTIYDISTTSLQDVGTVLLSSAATPLVAHFIHDSDPNTEDQITVLSLLAAGSTLTTYTQALSDNDPATVEAFTASASLSTTTTLKNFVPAYSNTGFLGDAALAGSMNGVTFTPDLIASSEIPLPFASKIIEATAGNGGNGLNIGKLVGKGGAGGGIIGINADANEVKLVAGDGGQSESGAAGAGGSVTNPGTFITAAGATIVPALVADVVLNIEAGAGGTPTGPAAKTASGGAGGSLTGLKITLDAGDITLTTGTGGDGFGGAGGAGGNLNAITTITHDGSLTLSTGAGGDALAGTAAAGAGGSIVNLKHVLSLEPDVELMEKPYFVALTTGAGGTSTGGVGGAGGSVQGVTLTLDGSNRTYDDPQLNPPLVDAHKDNTLRISVTTGDGGQGATGGNGGAIRDFSHRSVYDQVKNGVVLINSVVMQLTAGDGGVGTAGNGGAGGAISFVRPISGVTFFDADASDPNDPPSRVPYIATAGAGGAGSLKGGAGGAVSGLTLQNSAMENGDVLSFTHLQSAIITAGNGGDGGTSDGGAGGAVTGALVGTQIGFLAVKAGDGGNGGALGKGGVGGAVATSTFGVVNTLADVGLSVVGGNGGDGTLAGGAGGALTGLQVSTPQSTDGLSAVLVAGNGGAANSNKGLGGKGGDISALNQLKDVNSSINLIQAGNGGDNPLGTAGAGGNIASLKTVGFIGRPSDGVNRLGVFDHVGTGIGAPEIAQGLFSGRGGQGLLDGISGAVTNVTARQIAAIAAAVDGNGLFAAASKISGVKTSLIGFDQDMSGTFDSTIPATPNPGLSKPVDGFVFGSIITQVTGLPTPSFVFTA